MLANNQSELMVPLTQTPQFAGDYLDCKKYTNIYLNFNFWKSLAGVQKSDYALIKYDNGT